MNIWKPWPKLHHLTVKQSQDRALPPPPLQHVEYQRLLIATDQHNLLAGLAIVEGTACDEALLGIIAILSQIRSRAKY